MRRPNPFTCNNAKRVMLLPPNECGTVRAFSYLAPTAQMIELRSLGLTLRRNRKVAKIVVRSLRIGSHKIVLLCIDEGQRLGTRGSVVSVDTHLLPSSWFFRGLLFQAQHNYLSASAIPRCVFAKTPPGQSPGWTLHLATFVPDYKDQHFTSRSAIRCCSYLVSNFILLVSVALFL